MGPSRYGAKRQKFLDEAEAQAEAAEAEELWDRSVMLLEHDGGPKEAEGLRLLHSAVDKGSLKARFALAQALEHGMHGLSIDAPRSMTLRRTAAEEGLAAGVAHSVVDPLRLEGLAQR